MNRKKNSVAVEATSEHEKPNNEKEWLDLTGNEVIEFTKLRVGYYDYQTDIIKFTISISTTALFAVIGIPHLENRVWLMAISVSVLIVSVIWLITVLHERRKITERASEHFVKRLEAIKSVFSSK